MERGLRQAAERGGDLRGSDAPCIVERFAGDELGERRRRRERRDATLRLEAHGGYFAVLDADGEPKHVAADGIRDVDGDGRVRKIAGVARIFEMVENGGGILRGKYGKARAEIQREKRRMSPRVILFFAVRVRCAPSVEYAHDPTGL